MYILRVKIKTVVNQHDMYVVNQHDVFVAMGILYKYIRYH